MNAKERKTNDSGCGARRTEDALHAGRSEHGWAGVRSRIFSAGWRCKGVSAGERFRLFAHSPLWFGAPLPGIAAFVATFLLRRFGDGLTTADAAGKAAVFAAVAVFGWIIGIWAATDPSPVSVEEAEESPEDEPSRAPVAVRRAMSVVLLVAVFALLCSSQIEGMWTGEVSLARGFSGIVLKAITIAAVATPIWIDLRTR